MAAEEPGERSERRPVRSHPHAEEKAPEHPELHPSSAQERTLETTGPAGEHSTFMLFLDFSLSIQNNQVFFGWCFQKVTLLCFYSCFNTSV